jgi:UDP-N-acetyl-D-glucosamine dehydrogenase
MKEFTTKSFSDTQFAVERDVVCIQGLGFVGAAMAAAVSAACAADGQPRFNVVGVELNTPTGRVRADRLDAGHFPFACPDPKISHAIETAHIAGNLRATTDVAAFRNAKIAVVDVHLDVGLDASGRPSASINGFERAIRILGQELSPGALVMVETTVPPGTCAHVAAPALADELRRRGLPADAILLAHSYERVMPGPNYFDSIVNFWRVYAGHTLEAADACAQFLNAVVNTKQYPLRRLGSTTASETAKVLENSYRAVNIAFIEEWARFAEATDVDLFEVIDAIRDRPTHANIRQPGFGVGGYCLTKDPLFAAAGSQQFLNSGALDFPFCEAAMAINRRMPVVNLDRIEALLGGLAGKSVILLGIAYRSEVDDTRYGPAEIFYREAERRGARLLCHDPHVRHWSELGMQIPAELPDPSGADAVVLAVPHRAYRQLDLQAWLGSSRPLVYDADSVLDATTRARLRAAGFAVESTGRGMGL